MSKGFFGNLTLLIFLNVVIKPFWLFGIDRTVQNTVGSENYGVYFALFNLTLLFNIFLELGLNNFNTRAIAQKPDRINHYLPNLLGVKAIVSILYAFVLWGVGFYLGYRGEQLQLLVLCIINLIAIGFVLYLRSNLSGLQFFRLDSYFSVADKSLSIVFVGALLWFIPLKDGFNLNWFLIAQIMANALVALVAFIFLKRHIKQFEWHINFGLIKSLIVKAAPFALTGFLMAVYYRIDGVMLERMLGGQGAQQNGMYAAGFRILDAANMIAFLFATILLPLFSKMLAQKENVVHLLKFSSHLIWILVLTMSFSIWCFSQPIMDMLYTESNASYGLLLKILILTTVPIAVVYIYGALLTANHNLKQINLIGCFGVFINIMLNLILIPHYQAIGAAVATLSTQILVASLHVLITFKKLQISFIKLDWMKLSWYTLLCGFVVYHFPLINLQWMIGLILLPMVLLILAFIFKLLNVAEMRQWWKYSNEG